MSKLMSKLREQINTLCNDSLEIEEVRKILSKDKEGEYYKTRVSY